MFTGTFDDCFSDYIPILELMAPLFAAASLFFFARFAFACWAPEPRDRTHRWRLAPPDGTRIYHPGYPFMASVGAVWALWRAALYPFDRAVFAYGGFWGLFAVWFMASGWMALRRPMA
ncbi:hypothetical protein MTR62_04805 [Novosphingobium sp. 1949]|uniref:Uncharacterized protein n=1 Tax=Novosphingobium organovorum TaxID=2930092 RepID=A0ABT0BB47_9SPHN|nr:hypothetical protein [Novosphingobium organovorum]MCJ2182024.1 hypothetical protein [Novosphingobium organovorum]